MGATCCKQYNQPSEQSSKDDIVDETDKNKEDDGSQSEDSLSLSDEKDGLVEGNKSSKSNKSDDEHKEERQLSERTKSVIASGHLLATIIKNYFESPDNKCDMLLDDMISEEKEEDDDDGDDDGYNAELNWKTVLDNIIIVGGAPRDYLLNRPINDLDINANTRELTKLQLLHLKKYHGTVSQQKKSKTSKCIFWRLYINKFTKNCQMYDEMILKKECDGDKDKLNEIRTKFVYVRDCDWMLNAKFIISILTESE
eukprot:552467_1